ncbi:hypothetical protein EDC01DRAFT_650380 [Geopyxis carbonaria]|nr:hypothetical protein EDC01DRAFT_650380 [Geopyxis carbonaria]
MHHKLSYLGNINVTATTMNYLRCVSSSSQHHVAPTTLRPARSTDSVTMSAPSSESRRQNIPRWHTAAVTTEFPLNPHLSHLPLSSPSLPLSLTLKPHHTNTTTTMPDPEPRSLILTAGEGHTAHQLGTLLLTSAKFKSKLSKLTVITMNESHAHISALRDAGASIAPVEAGDTDALAAAMEEAGADTICIVPPSVEDKVAASQQLLDAATEAGVQNVVLISSAGCDMAEREEQPALRQFVDIETAVMKMKGDAERKTGHSLCIIRAGFYAENLLLYTKPSQKSAQLALPLGPTHKFAPVALRDVALLAAHVCSGTGPQGLDDKHRGQLMTVTGPMMAAGEELAEAASQGLGTKMEYVEVDEDAASKHLSGSDIGIDDSEKQYLLEYYALVRAGKTNYIATNAFHDVTGEHPMELPEFFKGHAAEFKPKKRKTGKKGE